MSCSVISLPKRFRVLGPDWNTFPVSQVCSPSHRFVPSLTGLLVVVHDWQVLIIKKTLDEMDWLSCIKGHTNGLACRGKWSLYSGMFECGQVGVSSD